MHPYVWHLSFMSLRAGNQRAVGQCAVDSDESNEKTLWTAGALEQRAQSWASGRECWKESTCGGDDSTGRDTQRSAEKTFSCRNGPKGPYTVGEATRLGSRKITDLRKH